MTKKDRIAIVVSVIYSFFPIIVIVNGESEAFFFLFPVLLYWGYRFVKNDISFLKNNSED